VTPAHLSFPRHLWLSDARTIPEDTPLSQVPYGSAISTIKEIDDLNSKMPKAIAVVETAHSFPASVENYWAAKPDKPSDLEISAEKLAPFFYAICRACPRRLYSMAEYFTHITAEENEELQSVCCVFQTAMAFVRITTMKDLEEAYCHAWENPESDIKGETASIPELATPSQLFQERNKGQETIDQ